MYQFKEFGIVTENTGTTFKGDKIKTSRIVNREIEVYHYQIVDSIKQAGTKRLDLQIKIGETWYVVFTAAKLLMEAIQSPGIKFPFKTTIIEENDWLKFT